MSTVIREVNGYQIYNNGHDALLWKCRTCGAWNPEPALRCECGVAGPKLLTPEPAPAHN